MFVDEAWRPQGEPPPPRPRPRLTKGQEKAVLWLIAVNVLLWLMAPIGGATIIHAILAMARGG